MKLFPSKRSMASLVVAAAGMAASVTPVTTMAAPGTLSVTGTGQVAVQPDMAVIRLAVEKTDPVPAVARSGVEKPVTAFFDGLKELGLTKDKVRAENISLFPQYRYDDGKRVLQGYTARRVVRVSIDDFTVIPKVIDSALKVGFNGVDSMNYDLRDKAQVRRQVRELAVKDAEDKAGTLANGFKVKLDGISSINYDNAEMDGAPRPMMLRTMAVNAKGAAEADQSVYEPEELRFTDRVDVVFRIDDGKSVPAAAK